MTWHKECRVFTTGPNVHSIRSNMFIAPKKKDKKISH